MAPLVPSVDDASRTEGGADEDGDVVDEPGSDVVDEPGSDGGDDKEDTLVSQRTCGVGGRFPIFP